MVERLEPRAEKKLPSMSISLGFKLLAIATEKRPATATSSHPVRLLKKTREFMTIHKTTSI